MKKNKTFWLFIFTIRQIKRETDVVVIVGTEEKSQLNEKKGLIKLGRHSKSKANSENLKHVEGPQILQSIC